MEKSLKKTPPYVDDRITREGMATVSHRGGEQEEEDLEEQERSGPESRGVWMEKNKASRQSSDNVVFFFFQDVGDKRGKRERSEGNKSYGKNGSERRD